MIPLFAIDAYQYFFGITLFILSVFLILLVLVQRGRGGGLTGALGGAGGQSAFGTKAGDLFTRITIVVAAIWIFLSAFAVWSMQETEFSVGTADGGISVSSPVMNPKGDTIPSGMTGLSDLGLGEMLPSNPSESGSSAASPLVDPATSGSATPTSQETTTSAEVSEKTFPAEEATSGSASSEVSNPGDGS